MESTPHSLPFTSETKPRQRCRHPEALKFHSTAVLAAAGPPDIPTAHWEGISLCFLLIHCIEQNLKLTQPTASFTFPLISPSLTHLNLAPNFCAEHQRVFNYKVVGHQGLLLIVCICVCVCVCLQPYRSQAYSKWELLQAKLEELLPQRSYRAERARVLLIFS